MAIVFRFLARHWLLGTLVVLSAAFGYANSPLYGAEATPTPNVSTVPKPSLFFTPTPTATPIILILTRAPATSVGSAPAQSNGSSAPATPAAPAVSGQPAVGQPPVATLAPGSTLTAVPSVLTPVADLWTGMSIGPLPLYQLPSQAAPVLDTLPAQTTVRILGRNSSSDWLVICCSRQQQAGWVMTTMLQITLTGTQTIAGLPVLMPDAVAGSLTAASSAATLRIGVPEITTLVWPGAVRQLPVTITNQSARDLTQLQLRYRLPAALTIMNVTSDQTGATVINSPTAQGVLLSIRWPQLAAGNTAVTTLTLQVGLDVPNGMFLDNQMDVQSSDGTTATATFTWVMPPVELPQFPAP